MQQSILGLVKFVKVFIIRLVQELLQVQGLILQMLQLHAWPRAPGVWQEGWLGVVALGAIVHHAILQLSSQGGAHWYLAALMLDLRGMRCLLRLSLLLLLHLLLQEMLVLLVACHRLNLAWNLRKSLDEALINEHVDHLVGIVQLGLILLM